MNAAVGLVLLFSPSDPFAEPTAGGDAPEVSEALAPRPGPKPPESEDASEDAAEVRAGGDPEPDSPVREGVSPEDAPGQPPELDPTPREPEKPKDKPTEVGIASGSVEVQRHSPSRDMGPIRFRIDAGGVLSVGRIGDDTFGVFHDTKTLLGAGVFARGDVRVGKSFVYLGAGFTYRAFATSHSAFAGDLGTDLAVQDFIGHARISVVPVEGLEVFAQAGGGGALIDYELYRNDLQAGERTIKGMFSGQAGVGLYMPRRWMNVRHFTLGVETGFGYVYRNGLSLEPEIETPEDPISVSAPGFGELRLGGFQWSAGLVVRLM